MFFPSKGKSSREEFIILPPVTRPFPLHTNLKIKIFARDLAAFDEKLSSSDLSFSLCGRRGIMQRAKKRIDIFGLKDNL